ncbi:MAG: hypothetical protein SOT34_07570 [Candidatus Borkfalkiaceae bacterium]|nr:hypothetical protein [Christensenellaceae bacterium]
MKKLLFKLVGVVAAASLSLSAFASCGLFTVNKDRDMARVAATVQIDKSVNADNIYKRDITAGYVSYGYYYVQQYSYSVADAYELVFNNLIQNSVIVQQSRKELIDKYSSLLPSDAERTALFNELKEAGYLWLFATEADEAAYAKSGKSSLNQYMIDTYGSKTAVEKNDPAFRFATREEVWESISGIVDNVNSMIDSFAEETEEDEAEYEKVTYTARTTPTMDEDDEEETDEEKEEKIAKYKANKIDVSGSRTQYLAKAVQNLTEIGVLDSGEKYTATDMASVIGLSFFRSNLVSSVESSLVSLYEQGLKNDSNIDYTKVDEIYADDAAKAGQEKEKIAANLWDQYLKLQQAQKDKYSGKYSDLETALGNVGNSSFVVYNPGYGYAYVSHLVIQFSDEQKTVVSDIQAQTEKTADEINAEIEAYAENIVVTDLRSTWVQSGYGTYDGVNFTFSDKYVYNTESPLAKYNGTIGKVTAYTTKDEDGNDVNNFAYSDVRPTTYSVGEFEAIVQQVMGTSKMTSVPTVADPVARLAGYTGSESRIDKTDFNNFEDIKFAFSTDEGNFNKYFGYLYSPITSKSNYVKAFAKACDMVVNDETNGGVGAYKVFVSPEYGLHIVLCTALGDYGCYTDEAAFKADLTEKNSVAYDFMKANVDLVTDNYIGDIAQSFINKYTAEGAKIDGSDDCVVVKYAKVYKDLFVEED